MYITGNYNTFTNENFLGYYPGWNAYENWLAICDPNSRSNPANPICNNPPPVDLGCIYLEYGSQNNAITALKNGVALQGFAVCDQWIDMNLEIDGQTTNSIPGSNKCNKKNLAFVPKMQAKAATLTNKLKQKRMNKWGSLQPPGRQ
jgi:hypothetical protein